MAEMEGAGIAMPTTNTLYRRYLEKITAEFRSLILNRSYSLDGMDPQPPRKPQSWQEIAECIELELESRADARAPTESVNV